VNSAQYDAVGDIGVYGSSPSQHILPERGSVLPEHGIGIGVDDQPVTAVDLRA